MFNPSRDQVRELFFGAWRRYKAGEPLQGIEQLALQAILLHPEYHPALEQPERYRDRNWPPELGETNPFLHLSLHLALEEQLAVDQPPGIRHRLEALQARGLAPHDARHAAMDCLADMLWQAQRDHRAPDPAVYFDCLQRRG